MRQQARIIILFVTLGVGSSFALGVASGVVPASHSPIVINGDLAFNSPNGVTGGSGTSSDPYVIQGWKIDSTTTGTGVAIKNTRDYFIIRDADIQGARGLAVDLENVTNGLIETSQLSNNDGAVLLGFSSNITLTNNSISNNTGYGVALAYSANITLHSNIFTSNGITVSPSQESELNWRSFTITSDNLVNGRPVLFYDGCSGVTINGEVLGELMIANCTNVKITNLTITNADVGILVENVTDTLIANSTLSSNHQDGLSGGLVRNSTITGVTASLNGVAGIETWGSTNLEISNSTIVSNRWWGIHLAGAVNVTVVANTLSENAGYGLDVGSAKNLRVYHNDFINNPVEDLSNPSSNYAWDNGYPSGGNYWTSYNGIDRCSGPSQNNCRCVPPNFDTCPDGIGDTPFFVGQYGSWNPTDRYPLMKPYHPDTTPPVWPGEAALRAAPELGYLHPTWVWLYWTTATDDVKVTSYRLYSNNILVANLTAWQSYAQGYSNTILLSSTQGYNATGLAPGTSYTFKIVAVDVDGNTGPALSMTVTTPENPQTSAPNTIPDWYLIPSSVAAGAAVVATALLSRRHYRKKESPKESNPPPQRLSPA